MFYQEWQVIPKHLTIDCQKYYKINLEVSTQYCLWSTFKHFGWQLLHTQLLMNYKTNAFPGYLQYLNNSLKIHQSDKIRSWTGSIIPVDTVDEGLLDCAATSVLKSLNWKLAHHFFTVEYDGHLSSNVCIIHLWISFRVYFAVTETAEFNIRKFHTLVNMVQSVIGNKFKK